MRDQRRDRDGPNMLNVHQQVIASLVGTLSLVVLASDALGQSGVSASRWADRQSAPEMLVWPPLAEVQRRSLIADELMGRAQPAPRGPSRDTLKNGAILGAVVGAVAVGSYGAFFCNLYEGDSCLLDTLRVAAVGAAIGAGTGLAIDAALTRHAGVAVRIGIRF